jgi:hypothetical protein
MVATSGDGVPLKRGRPWLIEVLAVYKISKIYTAVGAVVQSFGPTVLLCEKHSSKVFDTSQLTLSHLRPASTVYISTCRILKGDFLCKRAAFSYANFLCKLAIFLQAGKLFQIQSYVTLVRVSAISC